MSLNEFPLMMTAMDSYQEYYYAIQTIRPRQVSLHIFDSALISISVNKLASAIS